MREIKFKGQHASNLKWYYGGYHKHQVITQCPLGETEPPDIQHLIIFDGFSDWNLPKPINSVSVIPETISQYTGLKDKNGKEIYEGDIIECWSEGLKAIGEVKKRIDGLWFIYPAYQKKIMWGLCPNGKGKTSVEVIGNIYENPELLEVR